MTCVVCFSDKISTAELTDYLSQFDNAAQQIDYNNGRDSTFHNGVTGKCSSAHVGILYERETEITIALRLILNV